MKKEVNYKNWVPKSLIAGTCAGTAALAAGAACFGVLGKGNAAKALSVLCGAGAIGCGAFAGWSVTARRAFSYDGKRQLSKQMIGGVAEHITLPEGGIGLDVGCGSGTLTIACAGANPQGHMVGIDLWEPFYGYSRELCQQNALAKGVENISFQTGDAVRLAFEDETFDAVTSNYVYHNILSRDRQALLLETLRVLKKGGVFAIHDIFSKARYGDMGAFVAQTAGLRARGVDRHHRRSFYEPVGSGQTHVGRLGPVGGTEIAEGNVWTDVKQSAALTGFWDRKLPFTMG